MPLEFISVRALQGANAALIHLIEELTSRADNLGLDGVAYYGWPKFTDYDLNRHFIDLAVLSRNHGILLIRLVTYANAAHLDRAVESISQAAASCVSQLIRSPILRTRARQLKVPIYPSIFVPGGDLEGDEDDVSIFNSESKLIRFVEGIPTTNLSSSEFEEARSILEGAKALGRASRRVIEDPKKQKVAAALATLEDEIASFDQRQRQVALTAVGGPQRIRGLAGSGKTVILAMKAALAHLDNPTAKILVTFYTRSLRDQLVRLITRFHRHFGEGDPDWRQINVRHAWGGKSLPGTYMEGCLRAGISPLTYRTAVAEAGVGQDAFEFACRALLATHLVKEYYDLVLIDEGQDFPSGFYELCFAITKGSRDNKNIVWAYDELQNIFDVTVRTPTELFGTDTDGEPRISLERALSSEIHTNDFVLPKCYRNQRDVLVLAHASGFGLYGQPVQMLQGKAHWEDVGYKVLKGSMKPHTEVIIERPNENSPTQLRTPSGVALIDVRGFSSIEEEIEYCATEFQKFVEGGLQPEDLMAIAVDDRRARSYLARLSEALAARNILSNNIIADRYSEPAFSIEGRCTLTTVYRAKGNEAAVVAVMGGDAVPLGTRSGRNRLFTAFTRTKGWLRISGAGPNFQPLQKELQRALDLVPKMTFEMPDLREIELIQRDLSERDARLSRALAEIERVKESLGLTDEEIFEVISEKR